MFQADLEVLYPLYFDNKDKCKAPEGTPDSDILFLNNTNKYLKNCSKIYDFAIGIDFFSEGASWLNRKW